MIDRAENSGSHGGSPYSPCGPTSDPTQLEGVELDQSCIRIVETRARRGRVLGGGRERDAPTTASSFGKYDGLTHATGSETTAMALELI